MHVYFLKNFQIFFIGIPILLNAYMHIMYRYALYSRDANLIKILQRLVKAYNNRIHSARHDSCRSYKQ